jgi:hypothetical protein
MTQKLLACLCLSAGLALAGCTGGGRGDISGVVKYKGEPLPGGTILFYGQPKGQWSGEIKEDGSYTVTGVPTGTAKIAIIPAVNVNLGGGAPQVKAVTIPPKYSDPEKSGLTCEVQGGAQNHPVTLVD